MKRRKAPWHSPSECSFDHGYRLGILEGKIRAYKKLLLSEFQFRGVSTWDRSYSLLKRYLTQRKEWKKTRPE
jgi:hypothetical protein